MLRWLKELKRKRADTCPRAGWGAAKRAAAVCFVFGLASAALSGGAAGAADEPPASRTPLADTGLWEPPILRGHNEPQHEYKLIPADEGLAAFYGIYNPVITNEIMLYDSIVLGEHDIYYYGGAGITTRDSIIQYKILHQGENYVLVKLREFPIDRVVNPGKFEKRIAFGALVFSSGAGSKYYNMRIVDCGYTWHPLFESDDFDQTPERDIADFVASGADAAMRKSFAEGDSKCGRGWSWYSRRFD